MEKALAGIPCQECLVYLDDILAHRGSFQSALGAMRRVQQRVAAAGLKLHPDKCRFMRREVEFLGHRLGGDGISTVEEKVHAVRDWPTPTDLRQFKSFLGLASYYRRFVRCFSCTAAPLFRLQQTPEFQQAFSSQEGIDGVPHSHSPRPQLAIHPRHGRQQCWNGDVFQGTGAGCTLAGRVAALHLHSGAQGRRTVPMPLCSRSVSIL